MTGWSDCTTRMNFSLQKDPFLQELEDKISPIAIKCIPVRRKTSTPSGLASLSVWPALYSRKRTTHCAKQNLVRRWSGTYFRFRVRGLTIIENEFRLSFNWMPGIILDLRLHCSHLTIRHEKCHWMINPLFHSPDRDRLKDKVFLKWRSVKLSGFEPVRFIIRGSET